MSTANAELSTDTIAPDFTERNISGTRLTAIKRETWKHVQ